MHNLTYQNRITTYRPGELWWTAINWTGTQRSKLMPGPIWAPMSLGRGTNRARALTDKPQLKVTVCVGNRLTHMHQITHTHTHTHTHGWWQLRESDMPAITSGGCMFILLTCHRLGGRGEGRRGRGGEKAKRLCACCDLQTYIQLEIHPFIGNISGCVLICIS